MVDRNREFAGFSLEIERGDEEEPSQPTTNRIRPGSRATSSRASSTTSSRYQSYNFNNFNQQSAQNGGIQIIQDGFDDEDQWMLEDVSDNDGSDLESLGSSLDQVETESNQPYQTFSERYASQQLVKYDGNPTNNNSQRKLAVRGPQNILEVDTDEENDIVNKIKSEITQQMKLEIGDELKQLTNGQKNKAEEEDDIDPKIKEALLQMRKYDRILEKRSKRERHVKRERIALQKKLREELDELNKERPSGCKSTKDESVNTERFLSLPPAIARFDKEVAENSEDDNEWSGAPVFATEPPQYDAASSSTKSGHAGRKNRREDANSDTASQSTNKTEATTDRSKQRRRRKQKPGADGKDKDFIQRNIDLAADAGNTIAMTDDEKKRLADILEDLDEIEEPLVEDQSLPSHTVAVQPGQGFSLDSSNLHTMTETDKRLETLLGKEEFTSIMAAPSHLSYDSLQLFSRTHEHNIDITEIGERALQETREHRDQQRRLADIERELADLSSAVQSEIESPRLSDQQLHVLLEQCNRMMSRATIETDSLSQSNSPRSAQSTTRESIVSIHPHLDDSVLKSLLDQARAEGIVSRSERLDTQPDENSSALISDHQRENLLVNPRTTSRLQLSGPDNQYSRLSEKLYDSFEVEIQDTLSQLV